MELVIIESPYAGDVEQNLAYLKECQRDSIRRGEAHFASHRMYTNALDDSVELEREIGLRTGYAWMRAADRVAVYIDFGLSDGMKRAITEALKMKIPVEFRRLERKVAA